MEEAQLRGSPSPKAQLATTAPHPQRNTLAVRCSSNPSLAPAAYRSDPSVNAGSAKTRQTRGRQDVACRPPYAAPQAACNDKERSGQAAADIQVSAHGCRPAPPSSTGAAGISHSRAGHRPEHVNSADPRHLHPLMLQNRIDPPMPVVYKFVRMRCKASFCWSQYTGQPASTQGMAGAGMVSGTVSTPYRVVGFRPAPMHLALGAIPPCSLFKRHRPGQETDFTVPMPGTPDA